MHATVYIYIYTHTHTHTLVSIDTDIGIGINVDVNIHHSIDGWAAWGGDAGVQLEVISLGLGVELLKCQWVLWCISMGPLMIK